MMRPFFAVVLIAVASQSFASFEMMLAADVNGRVHRYDLENNVYLGSFGNFQLQGARTLVTRASTGDAFVGFDDRIWRFNYHTGAFLGSVSTGFFNVKHMSLMNDGRLMITHSTGSNAIDPVTGAVGFGLSYVSGDVPLGAIQMASGKIMAVAKFTPGATSFFYSYAMSSSGVRESSTALISTTSVVDQFVGFGRVGAYALYWGNDHSALFHGFSKLASDTNSVSTAPSSTIDIPQFCVTSGQTHTGTLVTIGSTLSGSTYSNRLYYSSAANNYNFVYTNTILPISTQLKSVDVVLAPEPGTMSALAGGVVVLLRRRKRKSSA